MSRAHRLIVVWMAGALGTVVAYGARRLQIAEGPAPSEDVRPLSQPAADDPRQAIAKYLQVRYDEVEVRDDGHAITGLAYFAAEAPLVEVQDAALRRFLPETRFFTTTFRRLDHRLERSRRQRHALEWAAPRRRHGRYRRAAAVTANA